MTATTSTPTTGAPTPTSSDVIIVDEQLRQALSRDHRPQPASALSASFTFLWRALLKIKHVPEQLFDVTMFPIMFTLMFTYMFGGALAGSTKEYVQFLIPGILVQTVVWITMYTGSTLNTDISQGVLDRFRSLPVWRPSHLVGALLADVLRFTFASTVVIVMGLIVGFRPEGGALGVLSAMVLILTFAFCLSWVWTMLGFIMQTPNAVMMTAMMVMFPLTFLTNIFVDPKTMPQFLQNVVELNPLTHLVTASRSMMHGEVLWGEVTWVLVSAAVIVAIFGPLTMRQYRRRQ